MKGPPSVYPTAVKAEFSHTTHAISQQPPHPLNSPHSKLKHNKRLRQRHGHPLRNGRLLPINLHLNPSLITSLLPEPPPALQTMPEPRTRPFTPRFLVRLSMPDLTPDQQTARDGLQQSEHLPRDLDLLVPAEEVEERTRTNNIDFPDEILQITLGVEDVRINKPSPQRLPIPEQLITQVDELEPQIGAVDLPTVDTIGNQPPNILCKGTSKVQIHLLARPHTLQNLRIGGVLAVGELEEAPATDAGVGVYRPGFFALGKISVAWICIRDGIANVQPQPHEHQPPQKESCYTSPALPEHPV